MFKLLFITFLFACLKVNASYIPYYNSINEGEYHMYEGQYELAVVNFTMAFSFVDQPKARDYYLISKCYAQLNKADEMYHFLKLAVLGGIDESFIKPDSLWFSNFRFSEEFQSTLNLKPLKVTSNLTKEAEEAFKSLQKNFKILQIIRYYKAYEAKDSLPEKYERNLETFVPYRDSLKTELSNYLINYPLPLDRKKIELLKVISVLFLTNDQAHIETIKNKLKSGIDEGIIGPLDFAEIFDYLKPTDEGEWEDGVVNFGIISASVKQTDYETILDNRRRIGLSTYYYDAPDYSKNYKPKPISDIINSN